MIQLSAGDINLLIDALTRGAARHESLGAALEPGRRFAHQHYRRAQAMRDLRARLERAKAENPCRPLLIENERH
jgi:hypothetical protein